MVGSGGRVPPGFLLPLMALGVKPKRNHLQVQDPSPSSSPKIPGTQKIYMKAFGYSHNQKIYMKAFGYSHNQALLLQG